MELDRVAFFAGRNELAQLGRQDERPAFLPTHWKLITLQDLGVDLKFEFNQSNRGLYGREAGKALIGEGETR